MRAVSLSVENGLVLRRLTKLRTDMRHADAGFRATFLLLIAVQAHTSAADDRDREFQSQREIAKARLDERMNARRAAGWRPKSKDAQMLTKLTALARKHERTQDRLATRAVFERARGEVYLTIARDYIKYGGYYRRYHPVTVSGRYTSYRPVVNYHDYWVLDPWSARLSAHFGEKAARSKGIAAAHEYHANTVYARRLSNTHSRIETLRRQISLEAQLGVPAH